MNPTLTEAEPRGLDPSRVQEIVARERHPLLPGGEPVTSARPDREYPATPPP
jgi:hypothetical protein